MWFVISHPVKQYAGHIAYLSQNERGSFWWTFRKTRAKRFVRKEDAVSELKDAIIPKGCVAEIRPIGRNEQ